MDLKVVRGAIFKNSAYNFTIKGENFIVKNIYITCWKIQFPSPQIPALSEHAHALDSHARTQRETVGDCTNNPNEKTDSEAETFDIFYEKKKKNSEK